MGAGQVEIKYICDVLIIIFLSLKKNTINVIIKFEVTKCSDYPTQRCSSPHIWFAGVWSAYSVCYIKQSSYQEYLL